MSIYGNPVMLGGGGGGTIISKTITANGTYNASSDNADGYNPVIVSVSGSVTVTADYQGFAYAYNALNGIFYNGTDNNQFLNFYPVQKGKAYLFCIGPTVSNRLRALLFYGKTYSDFEYYITHPASEATEVYHSDINITGASEITGDGLTRRFIVVPVDDGELVIGTSNVGVYAAPIVLCLSENAVENMGYWTIAPEAGWTYSVEFDSSTNINKCTQKGAAGVYENLYIPVALKAGKTYSFSLDYRTDGFNLAYGTTSIEFMLYPTQPSGQNLSFASSLAYCPSYLTQNASQTFTNYQFSYVCSSDMIAYLAFDLSMVADGVDAILYFKDIAITES